MTSLDGLLGTLNYDAKRGTDLLGTVEQYFASGRSLGRTHEALHIHVNTVTQRLDRTGRLLGADWQEPERSLEIQLALSLHRVMTQARPDLRGCEWSSGS
jgi:DNA-binding PucR family transcriptional regulator